jgi:ABC-type bacteriocin/lantibiotic exporter with double-glycine peptidase domain
MRLTPYAQQQPHTCAVACLRMVTEYYGDRASFLADWQRAFGISIFIGPP